MHANTLLVGLRLYIAYLYKNQVIDYFLDLFICLLYSCLGTSLECPAVVVSKHCSGPFFSVSLFHSCDIFTKAFTMFITNYIIGPTTVVREEIQMGIKKVDLRIHKNSLFTRCFAESRECRYRKAGEVRSIMDRPWLSRTSS